MKKQKQTRRYGERARGCQGEGMKCEENANKNKRSSKKKRVSSFNA